MIKWSNDQLVECNCNLCGLDVKEFLFERSDGLQVVQCKNCKFAFINPKPKDDLILALYDSSYFSADSQIGFENYFSDEAQQSMLAVSKMRLRVLEESGISIDGKVLEVGCATGELCHILHDKGLNVTGIDIAESAITEARFRYENISFQVGIINDIHSEVKYDAILAYEVIEHLSNPDAFFRKASMLLEVGGFLCLTTPNFECVESVGVDRWLGFSTSLEHLCFFSATTIDILGSKHGMHVVCQLSGGGDGLEHQEPEKSRVKKVARNILELMHLSGFALKLHKMFFPVKHNYQTQEVRHNLLVILQKYKQ